MWGNIDGGSSRGWWCLLVLFLLVMLSPPLRGDVLRTEPLSNTRPQSQNTSEKWDDLQSALETLKAESTTLVTDSETLSDKLVELQIEHEELKSSWTELLKLWENSVQLRKAEREASMSLLGDMSDQIDRLELRLKITGGVTIAVTVAGIIGWVLWAVK